VTPSDILAICLEEQDRARSIVAGLGPCPITLSRATTLFGSFLVDMKDGSFEIRISKHITDDAHVRETARHELAHQAAWERYNDMGHGPLWQNLATYLGCQPVSCTEDALDPVAMMRYQRYVITCERCGWSIGRQRRSKLVTKTWRYGCARCRGPLRVDEVARADT
jgi:predicted SprT family Zn-dependent metalloprotease